jgi:hypothetical protein
VTAPTIGIREGIQNQSLGLWILVEGVSQIIRRAHTNGPPPGDRRQTTFLGCFIAMELNDVKADATDRIRDFDGLRIHHQADRHHPTGQLAP